MTNQKSKGQRTEQRTIVVFTSNIRALEVVYNNVFCNALGEKEFAELEFCKNNGGGVAFIHTLKSFQELQNRKRLNMKDVQYHTQTSAIKFITYTAVIETVENITYK